VLLALLVLPVGSLLLATLFGPCRASPGEVLAAPRALAALAVGAAIVPSGS
jgi:hypothetical protein